MLVLCALVGAQGAVGARDARGGFEVAATGPATVVRSGFYEIRSFGGSSQSQDGHIYATRAQGIGTVYGRVDPSCAEPAVMVRAEPRDAAPMVAYVDFCLWDGEGAGTYLAADEPGLLGELERVSQDDYGLVVDRTRAGWARVIYGYTTTGAARAGWVRLVRGRTWYVSYDEQIREKPVWFEHPAAVEFFDGPNGAQVPFLVPEGARTAERGYGLEVLDVMGDWILVHVAVPDPSTLTGDPDARVERSVTAWVRRFDAKGRYQIAYAAAGC